MICNSCNTELTDASRFCFKCGTEVLSEQLASTSAPVIKHTTEISISSNNVNDLIPAESKNINHKTSSLTAAPHGISMRVCPSCGAQNAPNAKFCKKDGKPFGEILVATAAALEVATNQPKPAKEQVPTQASQHPNVAAKVKPISSKPKLAIVAGLITALATGSGGYLYFIKQHTQTKVASETPSAESLTTPPPVDASKPEAVTAEILTKNLNKALRSENLDVAFTVDERMNVLLEGEYTNQKEIEKIVQVVKSVNGVAKVDNRLSVYDLPSQGVTAPIVSDDNQTSKSEEMPVGQPPVIKTMRSQTNAQDATVKPSKKTVQLKSKKVKPLEAKNLGESSHSKTSQPTAEQAPQSQTANEQKPTEQPASPTDEQPKKHHGLRGLIERTTGVDPGVASGTSQHECSEAEKSVHANGC